MSKPVVGVIMGSNSDLDIMQGAISVLDDFKVPYEVRIISAHRTPQAMLEYAQTAADRGLKVIMAAAGGSAHLAGMTASGTNLPVLAIPIKRPNQDHEALWSSIAMPPGVPLAVMPENGASQTALMAVRILSLNDTTLAQRYQKFVDDMQTRIRNLDKAVQKDGWQKHAPK